jgi:hypothetical protein
MSSAELHVVGLVKGNSMVCCENANKSTGPFKIGPTPGPTQPVFLGLTQRANGDASPSCWAGPRLGRDCSGVRIAASVSSVANADFARPC